MELTQKEAVKCVNRWKKILNLHGWKIRVLINDESVEEEYKDSNAYINVEEGYIFADLYINPWTIRDLSHLEAVIAHEIVHIVIAPLATIARCGLGDKFKEHASNHIEAVTERISGALVNLYKYKEKGHAVTKRRKKM